MRYLITSLAIALHQLRLTKSTVTLDY